MTQEANVASPQRYGEVFDRGYAHYDGRRLGRRQAVISLIGYSMKRAMGIRKSWTAKVLPFLLYLAAVVPLIVMIGLNAIVPDSGFASYQDYMNAIFLVVGIFVATTAPEMLCVDRRERTLPLYFSRAIARFDYVAAKVIAMTLLTMTLSLVPAVILWLGTQLTSDSPWRAMRDNGGDLWRVIVVGSLVAVVLGAGGLAISSLTDRKAVAVTVILVGFLVVTVIAEIGYELLIDYDWSSYILLFNISEVFDGVLRHLFPPEPIGPAGFGEFETAESSRLLPLWNYLAWCGFLFAASLALLRWRYRPTDDS